jgi:hypothetical protein
MAGGAYYDEKRNRKGGDNPFGHMMEQATSKQNRRTVLIVCGVIVSLLVWSTFGGFSQPKVGDDRYEPRDVRLMQLLSSTNGHHSSFLKTITVIRVLYHTLRSNHQRPSTTAYPIASTLFRTTSIARRVILAVSTSTRPFRRYASLVKIC